MASSLFFSAYEKLLLLPCVRELRPEKLLSRCRPTTVFLSVSPSLFSIRLSPSLLVGWSRPCRCPRSTILSPRTTRCSIPIRIILLLVPMLAMSMLMLLALVVVAAPRGEASWNHCASPRRSPLSSHTRLSRVHVTCFASCVRVSREFKAASSSIGEYIEHTMERAGGNECRRSKYVHARSHVQRRAFDCRARIGRTHLS